MQNRLSFSWKMHDRWCKWNDWRSSYIFVLSFPTFSQSFLTCNFEQGGYLEMDSSSSGFPIPFNTKVSINKNNKNYWNIFSSLLPFWSIFSDSLCHTIFSIWVFIPGGGVFAQEVSTNDDGHMYLMRFKSFSAGKWRSNDLVDGSNK